MRKSLFLSLILLILAISGQSHTKQPTNLLPVAQDARWGYIDQTGKMILNPHSWAATEFSEGLAAVRKPFGWANALNLPNVLYHRPSVYSLSVLLILRMIVFAARFRLNR